MSRWIIKTSAPPKVTSDGSTLSSEPLMNQLRTSTSRVSRASTSPWRRS